MKTKCWAGNGATENGHQSGFRVGPSGRVDVESACGWPWIGQAEKAETGRQKSSAGRCAADFGCERRRTISTGLGQIKRRLWCVRNWWAKSVTVEGAKKWCDDSAADKLGKFRTRASKQRSDRWRPKEAERGEDEPNEASRLFGW